MESEKFLECFGCVMAFGYYLYLKVGPFKDFRKRLQSFECHYKIELEEKYKKVLILVPELCYCEIGKFKELERIGNMQTVQRDVAGILDTPFKLTVYNSLESKEHYVIDMAQCVDTIHRMRINKKPLTQEQKIKITKQFEDILCYLLKEDMECNGFYEVLSFKENDRFCDVLKKTVKPPILKNREDDKIDLSELGTALAYWYYYNYLLLTECDFLEQIEEWERTEGVQLAAKKMYLLAPMSCVCHDDIIKSNDTKAIEYTKDLNKNISEITVGATYKREYKKYVFRVKNENGKKPVDMYCIVEYANPIRTIFRMFGSKINEVNEISKRQIFGKKSSKKEMYKQRHKFVGQLEKLIKGKELYKVIPYNDIKPDFKLSNVLLTKIKPVRS